LEHGEVGRIAGEGVQKMRGENQAFEPKKKWGGQWWWDKTLAKGTKLELVEKTKKKKRRGGGTGGDNWVDVENPKKKKREKLGPAV